MDNTYFVKGEGYSATPDESVPGGKGANQAVAAARAGADVAIITRLGDDETGKAIVDALQKNGVDTSSVEMEMGLQNDVAHIYIDADGDNSMRRQTGAIDSFTPELVQRHAEEILAADYVVAQLKAPKEFSVELINFCHANGKTLILTPCRPARLAVAEPGNRELIEKISIITCNQKECATIFGDDDIESCVKQYPNKLIVTLGGDGVMYHDGNKVVHLPAVAGIDVVDTTGAGDTFNGNLVAGLASGLELYAAIERAQYAAAMKVQVKTAQAGMPTAAELDTFILQHV